MDYWPLEICDALKRRRVAFFVTVVTTAHEQKIAGEARASASLRARGFHRPTGLLGGPGGRLHLLIELNVLVDAALGGGLLHIGQNRRPIGNRLGRQPGLGVIAHGVHVTVRSNPGIAKQIPGAADGFAPLQDSKRLAWAFILQLAGRTDSGQPSTYDHDVKVLHVTHTFTFVTISLSRGADKSVSRCHERDGLFPFLNKLPLFF